MTQWFLQSGYPVVTVYDNGTLKMVNQKKYSNDGALTGFNWSIPLCATFENVTGTFVDCFLFEQEDTRVFLSLKMRTGWF
jgi:aminopeptidase N